MKTKLSIHHLAIIILLTINTLSSLTAQALNDDEQRKFDYFFIEACRQKMKGDYPKAATLYQNSLQINPNSAAAHFELGKILLMSGDSKNAIELLNRATLLNDNNEWYKVYLAGVYQHLKDDNKAIQIYQKLKENNPDKLEYYYHLGELYTKLKQYQAAINIYNNIEQREGLDEALSLEKQRLYLLSGKEKNAKQELEKLIDKHPEQARYYIMLGDFYLNINNIKQAQKAYQKAKNINPQSGFLHMSLSNLYSIQNDSINSQKELLKAFDSNDIQYEPKLQILLNYMVRYEEDKHLLPQIQKMTEALKQTYPDEENTYFFYANLLLNDTSQQAVAIENLEKVIQINPQHEDALMQLIQIAFQHEDFRRVLQLTDDALLAGLKTTRIYFYKGIAAHQEKNYQIAKKAYENGIEITPDTEPIKSQLYGNLGDINYELKAPLKAYENYEKALKLDEHNTLVMNNYAYYLSENDTLLDKAEKMSTRCVDLEPGNPTYLDTYAWILYKRSNLLLAKFYMEKAIHNTPEDNDVLYEHYGDILHANGEKEEAKKYWQKAINAGGDKTSIEAKIKQN